MATGLMVITAMATGVPIIATKTPQQKAPTEADATTKLKNTVDQHHGDGAEASLPYASTQRLRAASSEA
jgi:hypothetical protein